MSGIIDFFLIIFLLILTVYVIISNMTMIIDNRLISLKKDFINIKCNNIDNIDNNIEKNNDENTNNAENSSNSIETYGSLPNFSIQRENNIIGYIAGRTEPSTEELLETVINDEDVSKIQDPNFNTLNNLPFLIDPQNANEGYYYNRVKLITNPDSPLLKKAIKNMKKIDRQLKNCANKNLTNMRKVKGFNNYENLSEDSYANVTSIGKSLLTPYTSYPLPS